MMRRMRVPFFQLDAFAPRRFEGTPAAVMGLPEFPDDAAMLAVAAENNLAETAFLVADGADWRIRWFTPRVEVQEQRSMQQHEILSLRTHPRSSRLPYGPYW